MKKLFFNFLLLIITLCVSSCQQEIFVAHYGQNNGEVVASIAITDQDHFYVTGKVQSTNKLFIMRNDNNGNVSWNKTYDLGPNAYPSDVIGTSDGGCIVIGHGFIHLSNSFIIRLDANGQEVWKREFDPGNNSNHMVKNVIELDNGQIVIVGTLDPIFSITAPVIIRLDANGNNPNFWRFNIDKFYGTEIKQHPITSEIILLAEHESINQSLLMSIDPNSGNPNWSTLLVGIYGLGLIVDNTSIYISGHSAPLAGSDPFLLRSDLNGNVQWTQSYGLPGTQSHCNLSMNANAELSITGLTNNGLFLLTTDLQGQANWYHEYLGNYDQINSNYVTGHGSLTALNFSDGGYGIAAHDYSTNNPAGEATVIRTNSDGNAPCNQISGIPIPVSFIVGSNPLVLTLEPIGMAMSNATNPIAPEIFKRDDQCRQGNCTPPPNSLTAWFPLGVPGNDFDLITGNLASPSGNFQSTLGKVGLGYNFDGISNQLVAPNDPAYDFGTGDFSIDFWVNLGNAASGQKTVLCKMDGSGYCLTFNGNLLEFQLNDGVNSGTYISSQGVPTDNDWHFVAISVDRSNSNGIKFYIDGVQLTNTNNPTGVSNSLSNNGNLWIGRHPILGKYFKGDLDEIELFNEALSSMDIERIYIAGSAGKCKNVAYAPGVVGYCANQTNLTVGITICNYGNSQRTYNLQNLSGLPNGANAGVCNVDGPTIYNDLSGNLILNSGNCGVYLVDITRPSGLIIPFSRACYQTTFQDNTGDTFWTEGSVVNLSAICLSLQSNGESLETITLSPGQSKNLKLILENNSKQEFRGRIGLTDSQIENIVISNQNENFSFSDFNIPANGILEISLNANLRKYQPFKAQSLFVEVQATEDQPFIRVQEIPVASKRE